MGWTFENRPTGYTTQEWFAQKIGERYEIVESAVVNSVFYAATRNRETGVVDAFVALIARKKDYFNFGYKDMDEGMGPGAAECPERVLRHLTAPRNEWAAEWRESCRRHAERVAEAKALQPGAEVLFAGKMDFSDGASEDHFTYQGKNHFRRVTDGRLVQIRDWSGRTWITA